MAPGLKWICLLPLAMDPVSYRKGENPSCAPAQIPSLELVGSYSCQWEVSLRCFWNGIKKWQRWPRSLGKRPSFSGFQPQPLLGKASSERSWYPKVILLLCTSRNNAPPKQSTALPSLLKGPAAQLFSWAAEKCLQLSTWALLLTKTLVWPG